MSPLESPPQPQVVEEIRRRWHALQARISAACERAGRDPGSVRVVAVTKGHPAERCAAVLRAGIADLGENYVQEWRDKAGVPALQGVRWHFVGRIQRNKVRYLVGRVSLVHSVDRPALLEEFVRRAERDSGPCDVLVQVNLTGEAQKGGCPPDAVEELIRTARPPVRVCGLMTVARQGASDDELRQTFDRLRQLRDRLRDGLEPSRAEVLRELSMGMSADFEVAVECGATLLRIGTALVGPRPPHPKP